MKKRTVTIEWKNVIQGYVITLTDDNTSNWVCSVIKFNSDQAALIKRMNDGLDKLIAKESK